MGRAASTVSRELARNAGPRTGAYQPERAHRLAWERQRRPKPSRLARHPVLRGQVQQLLDRRYSPRLITTLRGLAGTATVFFKETTDRRHHAVLADPRFLTEVTHTFLIRAPAEIAASCYALQGQRLTLPEIGLEHAYDLYQAILAAGGAHPVVMDSDDLIADPAATVAAYCAAVGIPFSKPALRWAPGARDEWRQSARWHTRVSESTGFTQSPTSYETTTANNAMLARYSAHHEPFYRALRAHKIAIS
jgi:hypothetical protein